MAFNQFKQAVYDAFQDGIYQLKKGHWRLAFYAMTHNGKRPVYVFKDKQTGSLHGVSNLRELCRLLKIMGDKIPNYY